MKARTQILTILLATSLFSLGADPKQDYSPSAASDLVAQACKQAAKESKLVFLKSGFPECGWCVVFDRYHKRPAVKKILDKYFVIVAIDTRYMPDGETVFRTYAEPGSPSWVIISPEKKVIADSFSDGKNMGYPLKEHEVAFYLDTLRSASPEIANEDLNILSTHLLKAAGR